MITYLCDFVNAEKSNFHKTDLTKIANKDRGISPVSQKFYLLY